MRVRQGETTDGVDVYFYLGGVLQSDVVMEDVVDRLLAPQLTASPVILPRVVLRVLGRKCSE